MCGIAGQYNFDRKPVCPSDLKAMNSTMVARGPDAEGLYNHDHIGLAMRRLSIVDLENGFQPLTSIDNNIIMVFNGEIYNHLELRKNLESKGQSFRTNSDGEVIIGLYQHYGLEAFKHLNGMFAIALYDKNLDRLILVRDRLGIKPLYYSRDKSKIVFSSSLDAITKVNNYRKINRKAMLAYLGLSYVPTPLTIIEDCWKLEPGHFLVVDGQRVRKTQYWNVLDCYWNNSKKQDFQELLLDSVKLRLRADVEIGCFLSGGMDSSSLLSLSSHLNTKLKSFSISFKDKENDEIEYAKKVAKRYRSTHIIRSLEGSDAIRMLDAILQSMDEPIADSAIVPSYLLSQEVRKSGIKVMLSGAGGDEVFCGYSRYRMRPKDRLAGLFPYHSSFLGQLATNVLPTKLSNQIIMATKCGSAYPLRTSGVRMGSLSRILQEKKQVTEILDLMRDEFEELPYVEKHLGYHGARMFLDIHSYLPDNILALTDKTTMAQSIECRVPLLDHRIVESAFSKEHMQLLGATKEEKPQLKKSIADILDLSLLTPKKTGFNGPVDSWLQNPTNLDQLNNSAITSVVDSKKLTKAIDPSSRQFDPGITETFFQVYSFCKWQQPRSYIW